MLAAAEVAMDQSADDDAERNRNRARLYAPPPGHVKVGGRRARTPGMGMTPAQARALAQQLAAQDEQLSRGRSGT